jgi:hypothetical protein
MRLLLTDDSMREINALFRKLRTLEDSFHLVRELNAGEKAHSTEHWLGWSLALDLIVIAVVGALLWQWNNLRQCVTMCAWSKTIQHEGEWLSVDEYLRRIYNVRVSHGISEKERDKVLAQVDQMRLRQVSADPIPPAQPAAACA